MSAIGKNNPFSIQVEWFEKNQTYTIKNCTASTTVGQIMGSLKKLANIDPSRQYLFNSSVLIHNGTLLSSENASERIDLYVQNIKKFYLINTV